LRCRIALLPRARAVSLILMDVDGVLTDGGITFTGEELETRTFDSKDGVGLAVAHRLGLRTGLISGRSSAAVLRRARELKMDEIHLRQRDKLAAYEKILRRSRLTDAAVCYIGDDLVDLPVLARAGMAVAVADAHPDVKSRVPFVTQAAGGRGAVREVIDAIIRAQGHRKTVLGWFEGSAR
jgi:3-deoxy-D-manno-octulosonate 8-phosphate phosphatase (KDO 8-P phosphatase)